MQDKGDPQSEVVLSPDQVFAHALPPQWKKGSEYVHWWNWGQII